VNIPSAIVASIFWPTRKRLSSSAWAALAAVLALHVPIVGMLVSLTTSPLFSLFPEFAKSGVDVEWWFGGAMLKSAKAYFAFSCYFFVIFYPAFAPYAYQALRNSRDLPTA
jgi:hypothetical protein